jgi:methyl-accepting chemotaxis protein
VPGFVENYQCGEAKNGVDVRHQPSVTGPRKGFASLKTHIAQPINRVAVWWTATESPGNTYVNGDLTHSISVNLTEMTLHSDEPDVEAIVQVYNGMVRRATAAVTSFEQMRHKLSEMIRDIQTTSQTVASASNQMASNSEETGRAVGEVARAIEDVAHGAEQQARSVEKARHLAEAVALASQESAENAEAARSQAQQGAIAVGQASTAMDAVRSGAAQVAEVIGCRRRGPQTRRGVAEGASGHR